MDVKYLNYILAIANRHNMTKAAEDLFVSQSSLSQYLSRLEQELGTGFVLEHFVHKIVIQQAQTAQTLEILCVLAVKI